MLALFNFALTWRDLHSLTLIIILRLASADSASIESLGLQRLSNRSLRHRCRHLLSLHEGGLLVLSGLLKIILISSSLIYCTL